MNATPKLGLPLLEPTDLYDYNQWNNAMTKLDALVAEPAGSPLPALTREEVFAAMGASI